MLMPILFAVAVLAVLGLVYQALSGPSPGKTVKRRLELLRERHGDAVTASAQAQIRKLFANRQPKVESALSTFLPKPAMLKLRLEQTGKDISLGKFAGISISIFAVIMGGLVFKGAPFLLAAMFAVFVSIGGPHLVISYL